MGHEEVPCGFGLRNGDPSDTADGAGNRRRPASQARITGITGKNRGLPEPQASISFPEIGTQDWTKGERRTVCVHGCLKGLWDFNEDIKSLVLNLYNI